MRVHCIPDFLLTPITHSQKGIRQVYAIITNPKFVCIIRRFTHNESDRNGTEHERRQGEEPAGKRPAQSDPT